MFSVCLPLVGSCRHMHTPHSTAIPYLPYPNPKEKVDCRTQGTPERAVEPRALSGFRNDQSVSPWLSPASRAHTLQELLRQDASELVSEFDLMLFSLARAVLLNHAPCPPDVQSSYVCAVTHPELPSVSHIHTSLSVNPSLHQAP